MKEHNIKYGNANLKCKSQCVRSKVVCVIRVNRDCYENMFYIAPQNKLSNFNFKLFKIQQFFFKLN